MSFKDRFNSFLNETRGRKQLLLVWIIVTGIIVGASILFVFFSNLHIGGKSNTSNIKAYKVYTRDAGIYSIGYDEFIKSGFNISREEFLKLHVYHQGRPVNSWGGRNEHSTSLLFFGEANSSIYSSENVYWFVNDVSLVKQLEWGGDVSATNPLQPMITSTLSLPPEYAGTGYINADHLEENLIYQPQIENGDHWVWLQMATGREKVVPFSVTDGLSGGGEIRIEIWSNTQSTKKPDHNMRIAINGNNIGSENWNNQGRHLVINQIPPGILKAGDNQLAISVPAIPGVPAEVDYLDWIEIGYPKKLIARNDFLKFLASTSNAELSGFNATPYLFDISDPQQVSLIDEKPRLHNSNFNFNTIENHEYLAVGQKGFLHPEKILPAELSPNLRESTTLGDYIAIGPQKLLPPLEPLMEWRHQHGLTPIVVPSDAIYDQFNFGQPEPDAIHNYLLYAKRHWQKPPTYLLLVGDASYDPRGYLGNPQANKLPTYLVMTSYGGETASDVPFVQLSDKHDSNSESNGGYPDLAVGRIPARSSDQVRILVQKILAYEKNNIPDKQPAVVLAIADGQDAEFKHEADYWLKIFPDIFTKELYTPEAGINSADEHIIDSIQQGTFVVSYFGHGSVNLWGKDRLFSSVDIDRLDNLKRLPIIVNMTCLTGLFTHPKSESLAETFLWKENGGAVAVLAPTSLTMANDQKMLSQPIAEMLASKTPMSIGQILLNARRKVPISLAGARDVMLTFLLFGDPAMMPEYP